MAKYGWRRLGNITRNMNWHKVTVKSGDTLQSIGKSVKPAQSVDYLKKWNGLSSNDIKVGQTIKVYPYYIVQWGDTLGDIARSFETTVSKLHGVNPWIKNVNKIYPKEKIRLLEGMEPEETPPAPKPEPKPKPQSEPEPDASNRNGAANDLEDDTVPAHRKLAGDFFLRIGDVQLVVPPEFIRVYRDGNMNTKGMIRQRDSLKYKNGQSRTQIEIQLWFTDLQQINGFQVESPISTQKYFMDGLRPLIAQFKRMPFLPIVNEFLNDVLDIHAVAFSNMTFSTVEGFPDVMQATLTLYKMDVTPFIQKPSWTYDQHFMYPVFRWYYNQMLVESKPTNSTTYLRPVYHEDFTDKFQFKILNEGFLYEQKAENKLKSIELDKMAFDPVELPDDIYCTAIMGSFGSILTPLTMDFRETPTFQYMGALDTQFQVRFETTSRDAITVLENMFSTTERYSRLFRDKIVTGYIQVENSVLNMAGVYNVMIQDMTVATVPGFPDLFTVDMSLVSYHDTQYQDQRLYGNNMVDTAAASEIAAGNVGPAKKYLYSKQEPWFLVEEGIAEGMLDNMELYPDLELPTYGYLNDAISKINAFRKKKGHQPLPVSSYAPPHHTYRNYGEEVYSYYKLPDSTYVEPDFYFTYPEWNSIKYVDTESIDQKAIEMQGLVDGFAKKTGGGEGGNYSGGANDGTNAAIAWNFFIGKGFSEQATAGILGNLRQESGIDPKKRQYGGGPGRGIGQWSVGERWAKLTAWAGKNGKDPWALNTQLEYIWEELNGADPTTKSKLQAYGGLNGLMKETNINKAVEIFEKAFERAGKPMYENRYKYAKEYYDKYAGSSGGSGGGTLTITVNEALFEKAEADVLVPIPKKTEEESDITSESGNPNALMRSMMHDMKKYSKRGSMIRAFPTFVLAFVDEGRFVDYRRMWNNYYLYHSVEELSIVKERSQPVDTLHIRLVNIYGALNSTNRPLTKAVTQDVKFPGWGMTPKAVGSAISWYWHQWFPRIDEDMIERRMEHIQKSGFNLRTGARVHLRMGYGSVATMMPIVFNGRITEMDSADVVDIVCQSDALELINPYYEWAGESRTTWWSMRQEPKNIIDNLLVNRDGMDWLANYESIFGAFANGGTQSKFGIEHFGYVIGENHGLWDFFKPWGTLDKLVTGQEVVNGYDARKNVYTANGVGSFGQNENPDGGLIQEFDETNVHFWMSNKSPWDVMQLLTAVAPDYELKVHEHGFHSTLFYGQPQWYVKYAYRNVSGDPSDMEGYKEVLKVSQQYHSIDSMQDIITNRVKASGRDICTVAVPIFSWDEKPKAAETIFADPHIKPELQRTEMVDIGLLQDFPMLDFIAEAARWVGHTVTDMVGDIGQMLVDIPGGGIIEDFGNFLKKAKGAVDKHTRTERLAMEGAKTHIQWKFREMYKGDIIIIGDASIRPGDMLNITDVYTQMFGQAEVGRVVHMMSLTEGFVTSIKPDLLAVRKEGQRIKMLNVWASVGTYAALRVTSALMRAYIRKKPTKAIESLVKAKQFIRGLKAVRNAAAAGGLVGALATTGPFALGVIIFELVLWTITEVIIDTIESIFIKQRAGVAIMPLWYKNRPYVAGIDGHKELIPGYWDENYYGPVSEYEGASHSGGNMSGSLDAAYIPEGKSWVVPAPSARITAPYNERRTNDDGSVYYHQGLDYGGMRAGVEGDPIYAAANGTVIFSGTSKGAAASYGNYIIIEHDDVYTLYAHLQSRHVNQGAPVSVGQVIGKMGNTGRSTAAHLHLEVRNKNGGSFFKSSTRDPAAFLKSKGAYKVLNSDNTLKK